MDVGTIVAAIASSFGLSMAGVYWLSQTLIQHRLTRALEDRKAELAKDLERHKNELTGQLEREKAALQAELARDKAVVEGAVKREVELHLGERAAQRQYEFDARKRLYLAVGPLRFQLLMACRDLAGRIEGYGQRERYRLDIQGYYGRSTLYRLLRPLAIADLIERQIAYSDFSVDATALDCLRFRKSAVRILSGEDVVGGHPRIDWSQQVEHVFADSIAVAASALVSAGGAPGDRVMRFEEFNLAIEQDDGERFQPFPRLLGGFDIRTKPLLWLRLVAYGNACNSFVARAGAPLGFEPHAFPAAQLLAASGDGYIEQHMGEYERRIADVALMSL